MIDFPEFGFTLNYNSEKSVGSEDVHIGEQIKRLRIEVSDMHPEFRWLKHKEWRIGVLGNPIVSGVRNDKAVQDEFIRTENISEFSRSLNGSFLIVLYHKQSQKLHIISDRFSSIAIYYAMDGNDFRVAMFLSDLISMRREAGLSVDLDASAIFEFVAMRRLFGEHTYEKNCFYLESASILSVEPGDLKPHMSKYWVPDFSKDAPCGSKLVSAISEALGNTLKLHMSDEPEHSFGLFLSGGLDARAVLAASVGCSSKPLICITTCLQNNNESQVASEVATIVGSDHHFISRPVDLYEGHLDAAVRLCSGMHSFVECQFLGYGKRLPVPVDSMMMGLVLDVFLAGLYLPKEQVKFFGRKSLHYRLRLIDDDFIDDFMTSVSYRLKTLDPFVLLQQDKRCEMKKTLQKSLIAVAERGRKLGATGYKLWEYMHHHNFSRHYSFPMMTSIRSWADCRSPGLENNLFELAISMSAEQKVNATAYIHATSLLSKSVMKVRNANTNLPAWMPLPMQSLAKAFLIVGNRLFGTPYPQSPGVNDRSWPMVNTSMAASAEITKAIQELPDSDELNALDIFDMSVIRQIVREHESGTVDHGTALAVLLTVSRFLWMAQNSVNKFKPCRSWEM